jgi:AAA+ ATPase superfamily predicted ATPase
VVDRWKGPAKLSLVLDEFQWMVEASPELPSVLQELWDRRWRDSGRLLLVLCGSYVGFMEREVLGERSPLFGRRTAQIHLKPFPFREARLFHPTWSLADAARAYAI